MADIAKYAPINGGTLIPDFRAHFSHKRRTIAFAYAVVFVFIAFTIFLAFSPSPNPSSPWFSSIFTKTDSSSAFSDESYRSHFSSIYSYFFPNSSSVSPSQVQNSTSPGSYEDSAKKAEILDPNDAILPPVNRTVSNNTSPESNSSDISKGSPDIRDQTRSSEEVGDKNGVSMQNQTRGEEFRDGVVKANQSVIGVGNGNSENGAVKNLTSSLMKKGVQDDLMRSLMNCDMLDGNWVKDESYPLYKPGSCSLIDEQFNCFLNGRPDNGYLKLKWKPKGCTLPRLDGGHMLELLRGKRLVFVGDSLNRNMWESLICILKNSVKDQTKVYEQSGRHHFRTEASYSFVFEDYKCTVEFFVAPFLVQEWEVDGKNGTKKETLRLDLISRAADQYKDADVIVFNTGHWWTHEKTATGKDYYQEGSHVYSELDVLEAFRKAITTWGRWVDANVDPTKSLVFFRGYSASHFSGGQWNSGGACDNETEPIQNDSYLTPYPPKMVVLEKVFKGMKTRVNYLNVTRLTDYRKDGHPSIYRKQHISDEERRSPLLYQDCSHWCLPGVPDAWNEILYAQLLVKLHERQQQQKTP